MKQIILAGILLCAAASNTAAQGCVAIRSNGSACTMMQHDSNSSHKSWSLNINNRYFMSFRHFVGTAEQKQRETLGTQVINESFSTDFTLTHTINSRWMLAFNLPIIANHRSSLYEHDGKKRHSTRSFGIGDIRFTAYKWLLDPATHYRANIQLGLGIKLPTGDYKYQDKFFVNDSTKILGPVDQSIQLGDGGTGFSAELNGYYNFTPNLTVYGNFYYLSNPREQNGVSTTRGRTASAAAIANGSDVMSVPDQYLVRAGGNYTFKKITLSAGARYECLPAKDIIGGSNGFRRPGYIISAEPGITYSTKKVNFYGTLPIALKRNRTQSVPDKIRTSLTGVYTKGDAAFSDYTLNIGCTIKL